MHLSHIGSVFKILMISKAVAAKKMYSFIQNITQKMSQKVYLITKIIAVCTVRLILIDLIFYNKLLYSNVQNERN